MSTRLTLSRKISFHCLHRYEVSEFSEAENLTHFGPCYNKNGHGHTYHLVGYFQGEVDHTTGMIINLKHVDEALKASVRELQGRFLNEEVSEFRSIVPTTENIAIHINNRLKNKISRFPAVKLNRIRLYETENLWVDLVNE